MERGRVTCRVCGNIGIVDDERVDVVVRDYVRHNLLVLGGAARLLLRLRLLGLRALVGSVLTIQVIFLCRDRTLIYDLCAIICLMLQTLAHNLSLTLLWWLVIEVEYLCLRRLS